MLHAEVIYLHSVRNKLAEASYWDIENDKDFYCVFCDSFRQYFSPIIMQWQDDLMNLWWSRNPSTWLMPNMVWMRGHLRWSLIRVCQPVRKALSRPSKSGKGSYHLMEANDGWSLLGCVGLWGSIPGLSGNDLVPNVWKIWAPPKCKIFTWLAIQYMLWTLDRRARHGM